MEIVSIGGAVLRYKLTDTSCSHFPHLLTFLYHTHSVLLLRPDYSLGPHHGPDTHSPRGWKGMKYHAQVFIVEYTLAAMTSCLEDDFFRGGARVCWCCF